MVPWDLAITGAAAVVGPNFAAPLLSKVPGGAVGVAAAGALLVYAGTKLDGAAKAAVVGLGVGLAVRALLPVVMGATASA